MFNFHVTIDPNTYPLFYPHSADANQVLAAIKDVQQFYQDSFYNLLVFMTVAFMLIGIVMPLILQWLQNRSFDKTEKELLEKFKNDIEAAKADLKSEIDSVKKELKQDAYKEYNRLLANIAMSHAATLSLTSSNSYEIMSMALVGAMGFAMVKDTENLELVIRNAMKASDNIKQNLCLLPFSNQNECVKNLLASCDRLLDKLKEHKLDNKYFEQVFAIKDIVNKAKPKIQET
jgi:hypothetical protein